MVAKRRIPALVGLITVVLAGCGGEDAGSPASSSTGSTPEAAAEVVDAEALTGFAFDVRRDPG